MPLTESVAKLICTTPLIGHAERLLQQAGHDTKLAINRIEVDSLVIAQYIGGAAARWVVWSLDGITPQWVVGVSVS